MVERLHEPGQPLSRNRHFHAFDNPLGRQALTVSKRLRALEAELARLHRGGARAIVRRVGGAETPRCLEIELVFSAIKGRRITRLEADELELLCAMPRARAALDLTAL